MTYHSRHDLQSFHLLLCRPSARFSFQNSGAKYVSNKMPRRFQSFSVCLAGKKTAEDSAETFAY